jgi:ribosomal protein S18 acetylase RimI-like enzyme
MSEFVILNYEHPHVVNLSVREQVRDIFFESSSKKDFKNQEEKDSFRWKYLDFYLTHYSEFAWVALSQKKVLGYVIGMPLSSDPNLYEIQPHMKKFENLFSEYGAHLHINCHADARGMGVGSKLVTHLIRKLKDHHIHGLHIITGLESRNKEFYRKLGFDFECEREGMTFMGKKI